MLALAAFVPALVLATQTAAIDLLSRQNSGLDPSDLPAACQSTCATIVSALNTCTTDQCLCTNANTKAYAACLECLVADAGTGEETAESGIQQWIDTCNLEGFTVSSVAISTSAGTATGSATGSAISAITSVTSAAAPSVTFVGTTSSAGGASVSVSAPVASTTAGSGGNSVTFVGTGTTTADGSAETTSDSSSGSGGGITGGASAASASMSVSALTAFAIPAVVLGLLAW
ncbi:hypothetical protein PUNSTDRAFT_54224 [Punctularia strigosozonata HHB-11173 SS5]|uniref:uncharacterized protein n=1 Tax=Punctularia strigosozonata (strain HHB-11173) TaxID=741275 RepID=UPI0004416E3B|nr:uncharacterized protein PUNSTDRAFT_54224 [Punctularia strigosozonata HHB-11173 SS5]EIN06873.1 hypothetical protein PUNSTDRAFT_54224 [Punctularia strigosozonata HHB-11173 SS5]